MGSMNEELLENWEEINFLHEEENSYESDKKKLGSPQSTYVPTCEVYKNPYPIVRLDEKIIFNFSLQGLMLMLQNLPTQNWSDSEINILVAEAYKLKFTFADAPNHFQAHDPR
ncbi:hypothetical protein QAD02_007093 [Eretmocerus hayati]|uniref:Uncharacterized protein n=1 Tax=Eretmocerus hayati TaxID=131215 RepID=A0ACC2N3G6_9HYME|nr:hypothetical protein QAD02_007093 [Eretmocerus hayati]